MSLTARDEEHQALGNKLRPALERGEFVLLSQPKVHLEA